MQITCSNIALRTNHGRQGLCELQERVNHTFVILKWSRDRLGSVLHLRISAWAVTAPRYQLAQVWMKTGNTKASFVSFSCRSNCPSNLAALWWFSGNSFVAFCGTVKRWESQLFLCTNYQQIFLQQMQFLLRKNSVQLFMMTENYCVSENYYAQSCAFDHIGLDEIAEQV